MRGHERKEFILVTHEISILCDVAHCGREELHHFLPVPFRGMLPLL